MEEDKFIIKGNKREHLGDYNNYGELLLKRLALGGDKIAQVSYHLQMSYLILLNFEPNFNYSCLLLDMF